MKKRLVFAATAIAMVGSASAEKLRPFLTADFAQAVIDGCKAYGKENNLSQAVAVFDAGGNLIAFLRME